MDTEYQLKKLIQQVNFLAPSEKGILSEKISGFDNFQKEELLNFLVNQKIKNVTFNLKYLNIFRKRYSHWQDIFNKISQLVKQ